LHVLQRERERDSVCNYAQAARTTGGFTHTNLSVDYKSQQIFNN